jgi:hypothetical protein
MPARAAKRELPCHKLIRDTARDMAEELYEVVMKNNAIYEHWKRCCPELTRDIARALFVDMMYPKLIEEARATLAALLATNAIDEHRKTVIYDALVQDEPLRQRRLMPNSSLRRVNA